MGDSQMPSGVRLARQVRAEIQVLAAIDCDMAELEMDAGQDGDAPSDDVLDQSLGVHLATCCRS